MNMYYNGPQFSLHYIETVDLATLDRKTVGQMKNGLSEAFVCAHGAEKTRIGLAHRRVTDYLMNTPLKRGAR